MLSSKIVIADLEQPKSYPIDENGIPIKPGYRKPFTSETAKILSAKGREVLRQKHALLKSLPKLSSFDSLGTEAKINSLKRAHSRLIAASVASTSGKEADSWMRAASRVLNQLDLLLGNRSKRGSKPHLHKSDVAPISPTITPPTITPHPINKDASGEVLERRIAPAPQTLPSVNEVSQSGR